MDLASRSRSRWTARSPSRRARVRRVCTSSRSRPGARRIRSSDRRTSTFSGSMARALAKASSARRGSSSLSRRQPARRTHRSVRVAPGRSCAASSAPSRASAASAQAPPLAVASRSSSCSASSSEGSSATAASTARCARALSPTRSSRTRASSRRACVRSRVPVARAHAALVELGQILAQAERPEHLLQRVEGVVEERVVLEQLLHRRAARRVIGHALQGLPQRRQPLRLLLELVDLQARQAVQEVGLHGRPASSTAMRLSSTSASARGVPQTREQAVEGAEDGSDRRPCAPPPRRRRGPRAPGRPAFPRWSCPGGRRDRPPRWRRRAPPRAPAARRRSASTPRRRSAPRGARRPRAARRLAAPRPGRAGGPTGRDRRRPARSRPPRPGPARSWPDRPARTAHRRRSSRIAASSSCLPAARSTGSSASAASPTKLVVRLADARGWRRRLPRRSRRRALHRYASRAACGSCSSTA